VNLKGCCLREHQRLLVYEYVDNYDVDQILLGTWIILLKPLTSLHIPSVVSISQNIDILLLYGIWK
jgi:hypothetical protein